MKVTISEKLNKMTTKPDNKKMQLSCHRCNKHIWDGHFFYLNRASAKPNASKPFNEKGVPGIVKNKDALKAVYFHEQCFISRFGQDLADLMPPPRRAKSTDEIADSVAMMPKELFFDPPTGWSC